MSLPSVIVTRPTGQEDYILSALGQGGYRTHHLPLMKIVPVEDNTRSAVLRTTVQNTDQYAVIVVVSMNAAEHGLRWLDDYWPQYPIGIDWIAVGPSTAEVLEKAGLTVHCPENSFDTEGMLTLECLHADRITGKKVLLWRGVGGRETLANTLRAQGAQVDYAELYERQDIVHSPQQWQQALADKPVLMLSSTQQIEIVCQQVEDIAQRIRLLIVPTERSARIAKEHGFTQVVAAASSHDDDLLAALKANTQ